MAKGTVHKSAAERNKIYRRFVIKKPVLPPQSRLYSLVPIGLGTSYVESLTSYVSRLAVAHCLEVGKLISGIVAPAIGKNNILQKYNSGVSLRFCLNSQSINNMGTTATDWVRVLEDLTLQQKLIYLTMLPWGEIIPERGATRKTRAWCPSCIKEWEEIGREAHEPLLWSLSIVTVCVRHKRLLHELCSSCQRPLPAIAPRQRADFCSRCRHWLGVAPDTFLLEEPTDVEKLKYQQWVVEQVGGMLATAPSLPHWPTRDRVIKVISACVEKATGGSERAFVQQIRGVNRSTLHGWLHGHNRPTLSNLLSLCYQVGVPVKDFLTNSDAILSSPYNKVRGDSKQWTREYDESELDKIRAMMQLMLGESPPPSSNTITSRIGCHCKTLEKYFPVLYSSLRQRYTEHRKELYDKDRLHDILLKVQKEEPPPPLNQVAGRLGCSRGFLRVHFHEACRIIVARHDSHKTEPYLLEKNEKRLRELLALTPPISLTACAELLGCSLGYLRNSFPVLCRRMSTRYAQHRIRISAERRSRNLLTIKNTI